MYEFNLVFYWQQCWTSKGHSIILRNHVSNKSRIVSDLFFPFSSVIVATVLADYQLEQTTEPTSPHRSSLFLQPLFDFIQSGDDFLGLWSNIILNFLFSCCWVWVSSSSDFGAKSPIELLVITSMCQTILIFWILIMIYQESRFGTTILTYKGNLTTGLFQFYIRLRLTLVVSSRFLGWTPVKSWSHAHIDLSASLCTTKISEQTNKKKSRERKAISLHYIYVCSYVLLPTNHVHTLVCRNALFIYNFF